MSNRAERREAERLKRKLAYQQSRQTPTAAAPVATPAQTKANRANAQFSTGPTSAEGKATSARNAVKHGLTGNTVLLDSDDQADYQARLDYYASLYQPETFEERRLVQAIHDANWRLDRITNLESTIYAKGRIELEGSFEELPAELRKSFIELETSERHAKALRNLHIQEGRLQRQRSKDLAALAQLQAERHAAAEAALEKGAKERSTTNPEPIGFVFETPEITIPESTLTADPESISCEEAA
jgi:hypothetical protein